MNPSTYRYFLSVLVCGSIGRISTRSNAGRTIVRTGIGGSAMSEILEVLVSGNETHSASGGIEAVYDAMREPT
jgi:hypothetical protein